MLTNNPNKNKTIELKWEREINLRWRGFSDSVKKISLPVYITNLSDTEKQEEDNYMAEFTALVSLMLLSVNGAWQNRYQEQLYKRSIDNFNTRLKPLLSKADLDSAFSLLDEFSITHIDLHKNDIAFFNDRARTALIKWTDALTEEVRNIIHSGISEEDTINAIKERISVAKSRAKVIKTTETAQAAQRASINQARLMQERTGQSVNVRWITVNDSRVRHLHAGWHGEVFTSEQANYNMTISPWNCRCGLYPAVKNRTPARVQAKFSQERKALLAKEKK